MKELIVDGVGGFVVADFDQFVAKVREAIQLDRTKVRESYIKFNYLQMAKDYVHLYNQLT